MYFIILTKIQKNEQISVIIFCIKYLIYTHMKYLKTYEAQHVNTIAKRFKGEYDKINNKLVMKKMILPLLSILMTSGASCPDIVVESVIKKILSFYQLETAFEKVKESWID